MKINNKGELKALIKECLIEILSDGIPVKRSRQTESRHEQYDAPRPSLPPTIPSSMKSLFSDTQQRAASELYQQKSSVDKQAEVLGEMAETWESMAFHGVPLPSRAMNPEQHKGAVAPPRTPSTNSHRLDSPMSGFGFDHDDVADDGFDPLAAVMAARKARG
jgi:hypothetical protein